MNTRRVILAIIPILLTLYIAYTVAIGIGLHNLEGLAIGAALAIGEVALSKFLVI